MATTESLEHDAVDHGDHHHGDHPPFLAHHFDTPEQQFDSGKLGMWLFLVTEVLFFSGLFCAYAVFRFMRPEVFVGNSEFLNTKLGAINTGVLLFSSLTMAWAVRCAQVEQHKKLIGMLGATLGCAMIFLGVKAIEYSHKFALGLLPAGLYSYDPSSGEHPDGTLYLVWISAPFALILLGLVCWYLMALIGRNKLHLQMAGPLVVAFACYFVGVGLGTVLESGEGEHHGESHVAANETAHTGEEHSAGEHADGAGHSDEVAVADTSVAVAAEEEVSETNPGLLSRLASDSGNSGVRQQIAAEVRQAESAVGRVAKDGVGAAAGISQAESEVFTKYTAGVFFSIYYCMTGIHAIHIIAGIMVLTWLIIRAARNDFNRQYFGPVDYVGLYWHIVDLIWIYLFPLLYLIR